MYKIYYHRLRFPNFKMYNKIILIHYKLPNFKSRINSHK